MPVDLKDLPSKVLKVYDACIASKEVLYYPSEVTREENELRTEIRLCESLSKKPGPSPSQMGKGDQKPEEKKQQQKKDVFDPKNWDSLLIDEFDGGFGEQYGLLLNKFAVVPLHFLMVTKHWEVQTAPLTPPQLLASYQILQAFANAPRSKSSPGGDLLCFYNCGEMSGASQEHKHVQFAPMEGEGSLGKFPTEAATSACQLQEHDLDKAFSIESLPYAHHIRRITLPSSSDPQRTMQHLQQVYLSLLDAMIDNLRALPELSNDPSKTRLGKGMSYNLLMTRRHMHIIPRREATFRLPDLPQQGGRGADGAVAATEPAIVGCNALAYTGTVLVKSATDAKRLVEAGGVLAALEACGYAKAEQGALEEP